MPGIKLYSVSDSPPSFAVRLGLQALGLEYSLINLDYAAGEHLTEEYAQINPQREVPCLDDDGFLLSESTAILQYLADKYDKNGTLYPNSVEQRALINHRLAFYISTYYNNVSAYVMGPIFFDYQRTPLGLKKLKTALTVYNTVLEKQGKRFAAGDALTIADFPLVTATMCMEAIDFDITEYKYVTQWYDDFKTEYPKLWATAEMAMREIRAFSQNPPDLSHLDHPYHPIRKH